MASAHHLAAYAVSRSTRALKSCMYSGSAGVPGGGELAEAVGLLGVGLGHQRRRLDLGVDLGEHQVGQRRLELVLVRRAADRPACGALEEALQRALRQADRHPRHRAERPAERRAFHSDPEAAVEGAAGDLPEVDAAVVGDEELVAREGDGDTARAAHAGDVPVVEEPELVARHLDGHEVGALAVVGDAAEVGERRPQRVGARRSTGRRRGPSRPSTRLARPREAGKWLEPATRGPTHSGP